MGQQNISDAIRYVLVGFVGFFCYAYLFPLETSTLIKGLGGIPLIGCAMAGGAVFFFLYDALMLPFIHRFKDLIGNSENNYRVRLKKKFPEYKLTCSEAEYMYVSVLRDKVRWVDVPDLAVLTSGIHLLYMSSILTCLFAIVAIASNLIEKTCLLGLSAAVAALAGFILDSRAERTETALLFGLDDTTICLDLRHAFPMRGCCKEFPHKKKSEIALDWFRSAPLSDLSCPLHVIAGRINDYRLENNGFTPSYVFKQCLELGMTYACIELVIWVQNNDEEGIIDGVMLKERQTEDQGWQGKLTITGVSVRPFDKLNLAQDRLLDEISDDEGLKGLLRSAYSEHPYVEIHREDTDPDVEGRRVNCLTAVYAQSVPMTEISKFHDGFQYIDIGEIGNESIVDHHRDTLASLSAG